MLDERAGDSDKEQSTNQVKGENETKVDFENKNETNQPTTEFETNNESCQPNINQKPNEDNIENLSEPINITPTQIDGVMDNLFYSYTYILVFIILCYLEFNRDLPYYLTYLSIITLVLSLYDLYSLQFEIQKGL